MTFPTKTEDLLGRTFIAYELHDSELFFLTSDGYLVKYYHQQDCCESVWLEDINGSLDDLLHRPLRTAEETTESNNGQDSETWTFYRFATTKGFVTLRWIGSSNGYYSESVDMKVTRPCIPSQKTVMWW